MLIAWLLLKDKTFFKPFGTNNVSYRANEVDAIFHKTLYNEAHLLHMYLPDRSQIVYTLRNRNHYEILIPKTSDLNERHFLIRVLYKHMLLTIICTPFSSPLCEVAFDNFFKKNFMMMMMMMLEVRAATRSIVTCIGSRNRPTWLRRDDVDRQQKQHPLTTGSTAIHCNRSREWRNVGRGAIRSPYILHV